MLRLVRAEFLKLRTTQVWFWLLVAAVALSALITVGGMFSTPHNPHDVADIIATTNGVSVTTFVLGVLAITTEFRYQTVTPTLLATPRRGRIVVAKLVTATLVGIGYALVCLAVSAAIALPWAARGRDIPIHASDPDLRRVFADLPLAIILMGVFGVGVGALVRNQIAAVVAGLVFLLVLQNVLAAIPKVKNVWPYTPSGAITEMLYTGPDAAPNNIDLLPVWGGIVVMLAWALVPALIGSSITMNRDIT